MIDRTATHAGEPVVLSARRRREQQSLSPGHGAPFTERSFQVGVLLIVAGIAYSMWILEFVLPTGLSPVRSFVSEHYVVSQPYHALFRSADVVAGVVYLGVASRLTRLLTYGLAGSAVVIGLGVFGLTTVTDALFVPDCIATTDPVCERLELTGHVSWQHLVHLGSSVASQMAFIVVAFGIQHLATVYGTAAERVVTRVLLAILVISGLGCLTFYEIGWVGIPQRIQLVVIAVGTFGAAVRSLHTHHPFSRFLNARK